MTYQEIKKRHEQAVNTLTEKYHVFFAFSDKQLEEGKAGIKISDNKELISIGAGGYMPKANTKDFFNDMEQESERYKAELKEAKSVKEEAILYELHNHEAFYTSRIDEVIDIFAGIYTQKEIGDVYLKNKDNGGNLYK